MFGSSQLRQKKTINGQKFFPVKAQSSGNFSAQTAAPKVPANPSYDKFRKETQIALFLRFCKGGTKANLAKK